MYPFRAGDLSITDGAAGRFDQNPGNFVDGDRLDKPVLDAHLIVRLGDCARVEGKLHPLRRAHHHVLECAIGQYLLLGALGEVVVEFVEGGVVDVADRQVH